MMRLHFQHTPMAGIHITDIESAINYWRAREPSPDGVALPAPTRALAEVYALLVYYREVEADAGSMPPKALRRGWPGTSPHPIHPALPFAPPARATKPARAAAAVLKRCSCGPKCSRWPNAPSGAASRWKARPGVSTSTLNAPPKAVSICYKIDSCLRNWHAGCSLFSL